MKRRPLLVWSFAGALLASHAALSAQNTATVIVNEVKVRAVLAGDWIHLQLPFATAADSGGRAVAWTLSPTGKVSAEASVNFQAGARRVLLDLAWPKDDKGKAADDVGWYRVGYRIEAANGGRANGILSIGAIAPNLLTLRMALPDIVAAGKPLSVRIYAGNPVTGKSFRGVRLEGTLEYNDEPAKDADKPAKAPLQKVVREATTGISGEAILAYPIEGAPGDSATLTVKGTLLDADGTQVTVSIDGDIRVFDRTIVSVDTDKPLHKPGETVHLRALAFDTTGHAIANTALTLTIDDPENKTLLEVPLTTDRFGIASYDWKTGPQLAPGDYDAKFELEGVESYSDARSRVISIRRYELPEFAVSAALDRGYYLDGQTPVVRIHAGYLFGEPVAAGAVRIVRADPNQWYRAASNANRPEKVEQTATLDEHGNAELKLKLQDEFNDFKDKEYQRYRDIEFRAYVTDASSGRSEPRNFKVRLTRYPVHIYLNRMGGNDREGDYIVSTSYADGEPAACRLSMDWVDAAKRLPHAASVGTNRYGMARVHLSYPPAPVRDPLAPVPMYAAQPHFNLRLTAHDAEQRISLRDEEVEVGDPQSTWISVAATLMRPGQNIEATVHGPPGSLVDVDALTPQGIIDHQQVHMLHAEEPITVTVADGFHGTVTLVAYRMTGVSNSDRYSLGDWAFKTVLYPEDRELKLKLTGLRASYAPGAAVDAGIDVRAAAGYGVPSALGVAAFDQAVEQRSETEEDANLRSWNWWRDENNVSGVTYGDLSRIDTSQPISDAMQLVAEAGLAFSHYLYMPTQIHIEQDDHSEVSNEYESMMQKALKPVGEAILAARPARLPATLDAIRNIASVARLDEALLLDPWNTPYRVQTSVQWNEELVSLVSAGPDKSFGTDDDFTVQLTSRNVFALPGEQMTKLLREAVAAGQALPATVDSLKQMQRAGGLDLDATFDPYGKPFLYRIGISHRFYNVHVYGAGTTWYPNGQASEPPQWSSPSIDYFASTEARMEAALAQWTDAGKQFPETEAEARQALAAGGVDFDAVRDPLGQPLQLRVEQTMKFSHMEKVSAGAGLNAQDKPVTTLYRSIEVVRPADLPEAKDAVEMVAQFLHPLTQQSGSDAKPVAVDQGIFKGNTGAIGGTITDPSGAVVPNAEITATNTGNGVMTNAKSLANGDYLVPDLDAGTYIVEVVAKGFMRSLVNEVSVSPVALTTVDVRLSIGGENATVTVTDAPPSLNTTNATLGGKVEGFARTESKAGARNGETFTPRLRHVFEETAYWAPSLETGGNGHASFHFNLPDSLTTWKMRVLASTTDGRIGWLEQTFKTFQPFFVDLDVPQVLTKGDEISLPVNLRNYTEHTLALPVTVKPADWLTLLTSPKTQATVPANGSTPLQVGFRASSTIEAGPLRITAANAHEGDAVERTVRVHADGEPRAVTAAGLLTKRSTTFALDLPADAIPGSIHAELLLYPNLGAHLLHAMKAVLERPYGCAEQAISSAYPSLLYLELLKASHPEDAATDPVSVEAQTYLQMGYDRLMDSFDASGGMTYWGGNDHTPDAALTAYAIEFLTDATPYVAVDRDQLVRAINWLLTSQQADGTWKPRYGNTSASLNLYIASALAQALASQAFSDASSKALHGGVTRAVARATAWSATSAAAVHSPYANALRLRLANLAPTDASAVARLRAELTSTAVRDRDGAHWTPSGYSPFYGWGRAGELETTALVLSALRQGEPSAAEATLIQDALFFIVRNQDRYGVWYSGQATVRVLQALLPLAIEQAKATSDPQPVRLAINGVPLAGSDAEALHADRRLLTAPRSLDLTAMLKPGHNELVFSAAEHASLASAEATANFYVPWQGAPASTKTQTGSDAGLDFSYSCTATASQVGKPIDCTVDARRFGRDSYGMLLAEVGLPPGADVDRSSLSPLLDNWTISRYELQPDRIVFYLWSPGASGSHFSFRFTPRYAIRAKAAPAILADYYNPDLNVVLAPQPFSVTGRSQK